MTGERLGAFTLEFPCAHWGGGFFAAHDDAGGSFVVQRAFGVEAPSLGLEASWRRAHPHANMPVYVADGIDANGNAWLAYAAVACVRAEDAIGVHPVPVVLSWVAELIDVMLHHARVAPETGHSAALRPAFSDLLLTSAGSLRVHTVPSVARTWQTDLLRTSRLDASMSPPELGMLKHEPIAARMDVFAAGAFVRQMLQERADDPRRDISARTARLVQRATGPLDGRHESLDELAHDVRTCLDEFPPLDPADRQRAMSAFTGDSTNEEKERRE